VAANFFFAKFARSCPLAQPTDRRAKFCLRMHAGAAIEPDANFVLASGFELGDPPFFFVRHWPPEFAATLDDAISEYTYATRTEYFLWQSKQERSTVGRFRRQHILARKSGRQN
jgi:hypothetical protein